MTKGEVHGPHGPPTSLHKRIATKAKAKAYNLVKQAMPSLITFAGMGEPTSSSSQGPHAPLLPTMSAAPREQATQQSQDHQPKAADQSSDSGNTIPYEDQDETVHMTLKGSVQQGRGRLLRRRGCHPVLQARSCHNIHTRSEYPMGMCNERWQNRKRN